MIVIAFIVCAICMANAIALVFVATVFWRWIMIILAAVILFCDFIFVYEFINVKNKEEPVPERKTYMIGFVLSMLGFVLVGMIGFTDFGDAVDYLINFFTFNTPIWNAIFG